jgi:nitroreductase
MTVATDVLELARWAPSGDNAQPWRFSLRSDTDFVVHGRDTREHCVYDLDGRPSQIAIGCLLETISLAASRFGYTANIERRIDSAEERPEFDIQLRPQPGLAENPLVPFITQRAVQRRALSTRPISNAEKQALVRAVAPGFQLVWFEGSARTRMAWLNFLNGKLRLTLPEAYPVHRDTIDWNAQFSEDRIPAKAIGASAPSLALMRWAMTSWQRVNALNRFFAGTLVPRIELDLVPGLACGAHCVLVAAHPPTTVDDYLAAGSALQRYWLTAASLGLQFQPAYTPLVFARYVRDGVQFTADHKCERRARNIYSMLEKLLGPDTLGRAVFMGRIGSGRTAVSRSVRLPVARLLT